MATINEADQAIQIASIGHVFWAPVDTDPFALDSFVFGDESTYGDWVWGGDTSAENLISFEVDGGEPTSKDTWDRKNMRVVRGTKSYSGTINQVALTEDIMQIAFPGAVLESDGSFSIAEAGSSQRALFIVVEEGVKVSGDYYPNTDVEGTFPQYSTEDFTETAINVSILTSPTKTNTNGPIYRRFYPPRDRGAGS